MNLKVFNLMSRVHKTRFLVQDELCQCKCRLIENVYNSNQKWSHDLCRCDCKGLGNWSSCKERLYVES